MFVHLSEHHLASDLVIIVLVPLSAHLSVTPKIFLLHSKLHVCMFVYLSEPHLASDLVIILLVPLSVRPSVTLKIFLLHSKLNVYLSEPHLANDLVIILLNFLLQFCLSDRLSILLSDQNIFDTLKFLSKKF